MVRLWDQKGCIFSFHFIDLAHCSLQSRSTTNIFSMPWMIPFFPLRFNVSFNVINSKERLCVENHNEKKKSKKKNTFILVVWLIISGNTELIFNSQNCNYVQKHVIFWLLFFVASVYHNIHFGLLLETGDFILECENTKHSHQTFKSA